MITTTQQSGPEQGNQLRLETVVREVVEASSWKGRFCGRRSPDHQVPTAVEVLTTGAATAAVPTATPGAVVAAATVGAAAAVSLPQP
ncbi:unnamed protein product [Closterium sp. NIES-54]